ncbi:MAG TPA: hypothetical protein VMR74_07985, partial [Gammaproteobacteria bacterium]|nr:hypothetical protein [Gammaproteobacteria bacterium]
SNQVEDSSLGRFERYVTTDIGLTEEQYRRFNVYLRAKCQQLLETIDNWLATQERRLSAYKEPERLAKKKLMTGIGVFHFLDEDEGEFKGGEDAAIEEEDE